MLKYGLAAFVCGFVVDLILGDPWNWPHLVRFFGSVISWLEKRLYPMENKHLGGLLLVLGTLLICTGIPALVTITAWMVHPWLYFAVETLLVWQCLAVRSLAAESKKVYIALKDQGLEAGRKAVSMIVGRDTDVLDEKGVIKAAVETVAENASDGVGAPMFYLMIGGGVLGCFYKAVNTMDSMIGYRNDRYLRFGTAAARLDDVVNYLPARICALFMILAAFLCGMNGKEAIRIWRRDRRNHASPNSAQTESVMAGALGVQLAGDAQYFGEIHHKPFIGDSTREVEPEDILRSHRLLYTTAVWMMIVSVLIRGIVYAAL